MVFDRSNLEALVFPAIAGFFYFYYLRPEKKRWLAYICLAVAICLKIYPATLLLIPLSDKRFKGALYTALGCLAAEGVSMFALGVVTGDGFVGTIQAAVRAVQGGQGQHLLGVHMAHSLFGAIALLIEPFTRAEAILAVVRPYLAFTIVVFAAIAAYVLFVEKEPWRKAALLLLSALVLPYVSSDYTLIQLYPAIVLFLAAGGMSRARATTYTVLFAVLLVPTDYYVFQSPRFLSRMAEHMVSEVSTSVLVYPAVMLTIMALIVYDGFRQRRETRA
jgi:hypothetical protein